MRTKYKVSSLKKINLDTIKRKLAGELKQNIYANVHVKYLTGNKNFHATMKPLFSNKMLSTELITPEENFKL